MIISTNDQALAIETVTAAVVVGTGKSVFSMVIFNSSTGIDHILAFSKTGSDNSGNDYYLATLPIRLYIPPHASVTIRAYTTSLSDGSIFASIAGHWVTP